MKRGTVLIVGMGVSALVLAGFGLAKLKPPLPSFRTHHLHWEGWDDKEIVWGPVTNNLRLGAVIERGVLADRPSERRLHYAVQAQGPSREERVML